MTDYHRGQAIEPLDRTPAARARASAATTGGVRKGDDSRLRPTVAFITNALRPYPPEKVQRILLLSARQLREIHEREQAY
jgi:hypothetical protein